MSATATERATLGYGLGKEEGEAFWVLGMLETIKIGGEPGAHGARGDCLANYPSWKTPLQAFAGVTFGVLVAVSLEV